MSTKEKKRKFFSYAVMAFLIIGIFMILSSDSTKWIGIIFFALAVILLIINSLGTIQYSKGSKFLQGANPNVKKALPYFEKAVKLGVDTQTEIVIATLLVQYGDPEKGRKILEEYVGSKDKKTCATAKISLSMYWWLKRDLDKALPLAEEVYSMGYRDRNLYINLLTYYLEMGKYKEFKKLLKECRDLKLSTPALLDLEASYYMTQSDWQKAGSSLEKLFDITNPGFIDPYLHQAMVFLHYGEWEKAAKSLREIKSNVQLTNTSIYNEAQIDTLIAYIEDEDTRWGLLEAVNSDPSLFQRREMPQVKRGLEMPSLPTKPDFSAVLPDPDIDTKDEGDIDTSLTDDDEEWIRKHS